jgi:hypothetical protein
MPAPAAPASFSIGTPDWTMAGVIAARMGPPSISAGRESPSGAEGACPAGGTVPRACIKRGGRDAADVGGGAVLRSFYVSIKRKKMNRIRSQQQKISMQPKTQPKWSNPFANSHTNSSFSCRTLEEERVVRCTAFIVWKHRVR